MNIIDDKSQSVKDKVEKNCAYILEQVEVQHKLAEKFGHQEFRKKLHTGVFVPKK